MQNNYTPEELRLAREIAEILDDMDSLPMHLILVQKHKEGFLRERLNKVMSIPESQIKRSRAALYMFLINQKGRHGDARH
jgi:hypothetical protein